MSLLRGLSNRSVLVYLNSEQVQIGIPPGNKTCRAPLCLPSGGRPCGGRLYSRSLFLLRSRSPLRRIVLRRPIVSPLLSTRRSRAGPLLFQVSAANSRRRKHRFGQAYMIFYYEGLNSSFQASFEIRTLGFHVNISADSSVHVSNRKFSNKPNDRAQEKNISRQNPQIGTGSDCRA